MCDELWHYFTLRFCVAVTFFYITSCLLSEYNRMAEDNIWKGCGRFQRSFVANNGTAKMKMKFLILPYLSHCSILHIVCYRSLCVICHPSACFVESLLLLTCLCLVDFLTMIFFIICGVTLLMLHITLCKKASNHHANLPLEMYSFTL